MQDESDDGQSQLDPNNIPADPSFVPSEDETDDDMESFRNYNQFKRVIETGLKYGMSYNAITEMINSLLADLGVLQPNQYVSASKIRRLIIKHRKNVTAIHQENTNKLQFIGFDGKKSTIKIDRGQTVFDEKITVICQALRTYVDHFIPFNGKAFAIAHELFNILKKYDSLDTVKSCSSDGPTVNTGPFAGVIRSLETLLNRPLQWLICSLHLAELVFRKLFIAIDGKLDGPTKYSGPIGVKISVKGGLKRSAIFKKFQRIAGKVPIIDETFLQNDDVKNLYHICHLIQNGYENATSVQLKAFEAPRGQINAARWITSAKGIACLFLQTESPSDNLVLMVEIIVNIYGPALFNIRQNWEFYNGAKNWFNILSCSRSLLQPNYEKYYQVALDVLANNAYPLHPENVVVGMVFDSDPLIKEQGCKIIENIRKKKAPKKVRRFAKPKDINLNAKSYVDLIDFKNYSPKNFSSPPILEGYSLADIRAKNFKPELLKVPCHSQHVERHVYLTSQAAQRVVGQDNRHAHILVKQQANKYLKKSECIELAKT